MNSILPTLIYNEFFKRNPNDIYETEVRDVVILMSNMKIYTWEYKKAKFYTESEDYLIFLIRRYYFNGL